MANEEQLAILRQGVEVWNEWRMENERSTVHLYRANLERADLQGANLQGGDFRGSDLRGVNLQEARYDNDTQWSHYFNPDEHGATQVE